MSFLLLHGWQNRRPPGHWHHWLAAELSAAGHHVTYPQLPEPDEPVLADWLTELRTHITAMPADDRTVVCHSLGCLLWLHAAAAGEVPLPVARVLLVAPPGPDVVAGIPEIAGFLPPPMPAGRLDAGESPEECAQRELEEETGMRAGRLERLTTIYTTPGFTDERIHLFLATDLTTGAADREVDEFMEVAMLPWSEVGRMIRRGEVTDGKTLSGLMFVQSFRRVR